MKHKVKLYFFRAAPLILVCCIFFFVLSPSASAAETFDYNDYITNVVADGDNDIVSFQYPVDRSTWYTSFSDGSGGTLFQGGACEVWLSNSAIYRFECRPFGGQMDDFNTLRCDNIPDGTLLEGTYTAHYDGGSYLADSVGYIQWYSSSGSILNNQVFSLTYFPTITSNGSFSVILEKPAGATSFAVLLCADNFSPSYEGTFSFELNSCRFIMTISSLYRQQLLTGKTNELLNEVNKQLTEQGKTMDDVVYGDHGFDSSNSDFGSFGGDLSNSAGQANDALSSGMDSLGIMMDSDAFNGTLSILAAGVDAVFTGHEISICGVTANPFRLVVIIGTIAIILPLAMKFIFRKWGSGGSDSSGGDSSDA